VALEDRWATRPLAERHWADAADLDDDTLDELLEIAEGACIAYKPLPAGAVPLQFKLASVYQAREIRAAGIRDGDLIGVGDIALRARPLTDAVKALLRPQNPRPRFGRRPEVTP
jgi:hypothetical protein